MHSLVLMRSILYCNHVSPCCERSKFSERWKIVTPTHVSGPFFKCSSIIQTFHARKPSSRFVAHYEIYFVSLVLALFCITDSLVIFLYRIFYRTVYAWTIVAWLRPRGTVLVQSWKRQVLLIEVVLCVRSRNCFYGPRQWVYSNAHMSFKFYVLSHKRI